MKLHMQTVVAQQHPRRLVDAALVTPELRWIGEGGGVTAFDDDPQLTIDQAKARRALVTAIGEGKVGVEEIPPPGHHFTGPGHIEACLTRCIAVTGDCIAAVEGIVEAAPAGIGGIEGEARVAHRNHQLGACQLGNFLVDARGGNGRWRLLCHQVTDAGEKIPVFAPIELLPATRPVPGIDLCLEDIAAFQQLTIGRSKLRHQGGKAAPEQGAVDACTGEDVVVHQPVKCPVDPQARGFDMFGGGVGTGELAGHRLAPVE